MKDRFKNLFLNDKFILVVILINSILIYLQVSGYEDKLIGSLDMVCTLIFLLERLLRLASSAISTRWRLPPGSSTAEYKKHNTALKNPLRQSFPSSKSTRIHRKRTSVSLAVLTMG